MRKGTHSCIECRRRKIRCIWPKTSPKCNFCSNRKEECVEQVYGDVRVLALRRKQRKKSGLERIDELARSVGEVLERLDAKRFPEELALGALKNLQQTLKDLPGLRGDAVTFEDRVKTAGAHEDFENDNISLSNAPLLSLFDNFLFNIEESSPEESLAPAASNSLHLRISKMNIRILEELRPLVPNRSALGRILGNNRVALCTLQKNFPDLPGLKLFLDDHRLEVLTEYMLVTLASENITAVAEVVACLATCFQQLPHNFDLGSDSLPAPLNILEKCYMEFIETLLGPDEGIVSSITGVKCLLVQVGYYLKLGLPTKAWITFRRALTFSQILGSFQKSSTERPNSESRALMLELWNLDRRLSLLFGFPYATAHLQPRIEPLILALPAVAIFRYNLSRVATRIIDRNQQPDNTPLSETIAIDLELEKCQDLMPADWWKGGAESTMREEEIYDMYTAKLWYHNLRNLLYLPFFTKALAKSENKMTALAGLRASREVICCYQILRNVQRPVLRKCNLIDFQAFTAGMIVVLALLEQCNFCSGCDWEIVSRLVHILDRTASEFPHGVATQACQLLQELSQLREREFDSAETFHAVVPYFGKMEFRIPNTPRPFQTLAGNDNTDDSVLEPMVGLESYSHGLELESWGAPGEQWASMVDFGLEEDWSWNFNNEDLTIGQETGSWQNSQ